MTKALPQSTKIETTAEAFVSALKQSLKPEKKSTIPVLSQVKLDAGTITATDLDLTSIVPFESTGSGSFLVPYHQALNVLTGESGPLSIEFKPASEHTNAKVTFKLTECEYTFDSGAITNFPQTSAIPAKPALTIDGAKFRTLLDRTMFAISKEESRYTINGALLKASRDKLTMVATDGHRLSVAYAVQEGAKIEDTKIRRDALEFIRTRVNGSISIAEDEYSHFFHTNGITLIARKLTGNFPNYEAVLPRNMEIHATIDSAAKLSPVLARVAKCSDVRSGAVKFAFNGSLALSAESLDNGSAFALFECKASDAVTVGLNSKYVLEYLKQAGDAAVEVSIKDAQSAVKFSVEDWDYILMPMRM